LLAISAPLYLFLKIQSVLETPYLGGCDCLLRNRRRRLHYQKEINAEVAAMRAEDRRKESNRSAQQGTVNPPNNANCKYGGWSRAGTARFNELYSLDEEDRASQQLEQMEHELMAYCRAKAGIYDGNAQGEQEGQSDNNALEGTEVLPVETAWDLDD
jgi:hypothetical protein